MSVHRCRTSVLGIELWSGTLVVEREPNQLDEPAVAVSHVLDQFDIENVSIAGCVSMLAGQARDSDRELAVAADPSRGCV